MAATIRAALFELVQRFFFYALLLQIWHYLSFILFSPFAPVWPLSPLCIALSSLEVLTPMSPFLFRTRDRIKLYR